MRTRFSLIAAAAALFLIEAVATGGAQAKGSRTAPSAFDPPLAAAPVNDRCDGAILISCGNISLAGNTNLATNDYTLPNGPASCTGYSADGRDVVYKLNVGVGDSLWVDYRAIADGSIYIVRSCDSVATTCVVGSDSTANPNEVERIRYKFQVAGTYFLILDSFGLDTSGDWTLFGQLICGPQSPPRNDFCEGAIPIACGPFSFSGSTEFAHNLYAFPSAAGSCTGQRADGKDVAYRIRVRAGDSLAVDYTSTTNGSVYIVGNCNDVAGTCIVGVDAAPSGGTEVLRHKFTFAGTYYVILDSRDPDSFGTWSANGNFVCLTPPPVNDRCEGAIAIDCGTFMLSGSTEMAENDYFFNNIDQSCTGFPTDGRDVVYRFDVLAGDSLWADYRNTEDGTLYIVTNCDSVGVSCVRGVDVGVQDETEFLRYRFPANGTYYLILDTVDPATFGTWTMSGGLICSRVSVDDRPPGGRIAFGRILPNPFSGWTTITYALPSRARATLRVYDLQGRAARTLLDEEVDAGEHRVTWDGRDDEGRKVLPGVYFARLSSAGQDAVERMIVIR